ncbi:MAG: helix-turn-helix transcriptional regulator [Deltaproteobacteria bacterium]|nr:helix-turn-helix transcriptional regulator [Deltaproteobacteria bacterium]
MADSAFKALADPTRREILRLLAQHDELSAGALGDAFDISQPAVSRHLAVLRAAGLVSTRRDGQNVMYALDTTVVQDVMRVLLDLGAKKGARK